jgi:hypothetical protein
MRRALVALWFVVGVVVWNGIFDLYVSRGAREYGQKAAEADLGFGPRVTMADVMDHARRDGVVAASVWAAVLGGCGLATTWLAGRTRPSGPGTPSEPPKG